MGDLLSRQPRRYLDLRAADDWDLVSHGVIGATVAVVGVVAERREIGAARSRGLSVSLQATARDTSLRLVFFRAPPALAAKFRLGATLRAIGVLREGTSRLELHQPRVLSPTASYPLIEPIYSSIGTLSATSVRKLVESALLRIEQWAEIAPAEAVSHFVLRRARDALAHIHAPRADVLVQELLALQRGVSNAHQRLAFDELLTMMITIERARREHGTVVAIKTATPQALKTAVEERLTIRCTQGQIHAVDQLIAGLASAKPMRTLLVGDVGSGKTAVAAVASLACIRAGLAVAWLAPTAIVAQQHAHTLSRALRGEGGPIALLLGSTAKRAKTAALKAISAGLVRVVVGTHAILDSGALPPTLGLAVIDEQHRFGVAQRRMLVSQRPAHLLVLSATPIPRSLAMSQFGDLEIVTMRGLPEGRQPITSRVCACSDEEFLGRTIERALAASGGTGRVFVVVPRIDADEHGTSCIASADTLLSKWIGRDRISVLHGRLRADQQADALQAFRSGTHPVLLSTSIVEVGVDVPDANLMVVLGADQFGLAQLHQLRGRVGRGGQKSACIFATESPSSEVAERLQYVAECTDGFELASRDLERRGAGEWFGERQSGVDRTLHFADPIRDHVLLDQAAAWARTIIASDPTLAAHQPLLRASERLLARVPSPTAEEAG